MVARWPGASTTPVTGTTVPNQLLLELEAVNVLWSPEHEQRLPSCAFAVVDKLDRHLTTVGNVAGQREDDVRQSSATVALVAVHRIAHSVYEGLEHDARPAPPAPPPPRRTVADPQGAPASDELYASID